MKRSLCFVACLFFCISFYFSASAQSVSINTTGATANTSSILDVSSTTKGVLIPRMTKTEKNAIASPATGLLIFQTTPDSIGFHYYNGSIWVWLGNGNALQDTINWKTHGNLGLTDANSFLGNIDNVPLNFRVNNIRVGRLDLANSIYSLGIGAGINATAIGSVNIGDSAGAKVATGASINIGYHAGVNTTTGNNVFIGTYAGEQTTATGVSNTSVGYQSLRSHVSGSSNTTFGLNSMYSDTSGFNNTAIGRSAMFSHLRGNWNTGLGMYSGYYGDTTNETTLLGVQAGYTNKSNYITAVGTNALYANNYTNNGDPLAGTENTAIGHSAMTSNAYGRQNTAVGHHALTSAPGFYYGGASPSRNSAVGDSAASAIAGNDNVAMGYMALGKGLSPSQSVAVGSRALSQFDNTYPNTAVGYSSQDSATTGGANTTLGSFSLTKNKQGFNNTAIGNAAMYEAVNNQSTNYMFDNTAVGNDAMRFTRYYGQTAIGSGSLRNDTAGVYNTAIGYVAMYNNLRGVSNTAVGTSALRNDTSGNINTAVGVNALYNHKIGDNNVAYGYQSLFNDIDGGANTAIGTSAMYNHKTNGVNTAVGFETMFYDTAGSYNAAYGFRALRYSKKSFENTALGVGSIEYTDSAYYNTSVGRGAMFQKGGKWNTTVGYYAAGEGVGTFTSGMYTNSTTNIGAFAGFRSKADENTFVGFYSGAGVGADTLKGIENTALGSYTLTATTTGKSNTAIGMGTLYNNTTGSGNVTVGTRALLNNTTGSGNIAIGDSAMYNNGTGTGNTVIGYLANTSISNWTNASAIGNRAYVAANNSMVLGSISGTNGATADVNVGIGITVPVQKLHVVAPSTVRNAGYFVSSNTSNNYSSNGSAVLAENNAAGNVDAAGVIGSALLTNKGYGVGGYFQSGFIGSYNKVSDVSPGTSGFPTYGTVSENTITNAAGSANYGSYTTASGSTTGNYGVLASAGSIATNNYGVTSSASGATTANYGTNSSGTGSALTNYGVYGSASGATSANYGLYGSVSGAATNASTRYAVFGTAGSGTNYWAGYFNGFVFSTQTLQVSDERLKTAFKPTEGLLAKLMKVKVSEYEYDQDLSKQNNMAVPQGRQIGFTAQNLALQFPGLVQDVNHPINEELQENNNTLSKDGSLKSTNSITSKVVSKGFYKFKGVNYSGMVPVLTEAIQEQQQIIDKQQKQIDDLLKRIEKIENK